MKNIWTLDLIARAAGHDIRNAFLIQFEGVKQP